MTNMKFSDLKDNELKNKVRTIKDLMNYIGRTPPSHCSYNIFLGAGASVSSGIHSGANLVEEWRKEIYEQLKGENYYSNLQDEADINTAAKNRAVEYLIRDHGVWYNPQNEYSSLFERKFDLPSQRRRFVESLVDEKLPSIGYLYLITLINKGYFNTIFTTNFDDLINEAFYQFSNTRPILCAHDSAVNSISIVSKRPKIIKLHGDYLFDDIKNTIRETESLEINTKDKFIEFSKDNGLIIIGYSGQDRSIIEVLNYLLQQEDYLKNGIYWCFRPGDEINHEVRKILWKDKVYCVEIPSFDDFFVNLCHYIPIKPNLNDIDKDSKKEKCIIKFIEDYRNSSNQNPNTQEFFDEISNLRNNQNISDLIRQLNERKNGTLSSEKLKDLLEVENFINKNNFKEALVIINNKLESKLDDELRNQYIGLKLKILNLEKNIEKAMELVNSLLLEDAYNLQYFQWKISLIHSLDEKIKYLRESKDKFPFSFNFKNLLLGYIIEQTKNHKTTANLDFNECENLINESLNLDSSLDNDVYMLNFEYLLLKKQKIISQKNNKNNSLQRNEKECNDALDNLVSCVKKINKFHNETIKIRKFFVIERKDISLIKEYIHDLMGLKKYSSKEKNKLIDFNIANVYFNLSTSDLDTFINLENFGMKDIFTYFKKSEHNENMINNIKFQLEKAKFLISKQKNIDLIQNCLTNILGLVDAPEFIRSIINIFHKLKDDKINYDLKQFIIKSEVNIAKSDYYYCMHTIESSFLNYDESLRYLNKFYSIEPLKSDDFASYTYELLIAKKYQEVLSFVQKNSNEIENLSKKDQQILSINKLTAKKLSGIKLDENDQSILRNIVSNSSDDKSTLICANSVLDNNNGMLFHIKEQIKLDYRFYYNAIEWPAINETLKVEIITHFESLNNEEEIRTAC
ncbi:SIR2 family protein [Acinetobacter soli]|uniref:SIR2 family protein n=1 Tax=Acinetobacter soli TaxID=487316 RepID=UPI0032B3715D